MREIRIRVSTYIAVCEAIIGKSDDGLMLSRRVFWIMNVVNILPILVVCCVEERVDTVIQRLVVVSIQRQVVFPMSPCSGRGK